MGIAWYRKEDYDRILKIFDNPDDLPGTYDEWHVMAEKLFETVLKTQARPVKVIIDPDEFPKWCAANGRNIDADARKAYGTMMALKSLREVN
jgi:hypothetical protein